MLDLKDRLDAFQKEGSEKFAALCASDNAVHNFASTIRENSADDYDLARVTDAVISTLKQSVDQSAEVYNMFARPDKSE